MVPTPIDWYALIHGTRGLVVGYLVVALPMGIGLIQRPAALRQFVRWPLIAVFVTVLATVAWVASPGAGRRAGRAPA